MPRFQKGQCANPSGRPKGIKDKRCQLRNLLKPHAPALIAKAVDMGLKGHEGALRMCLDNLLPRLKPTSEPQQVNIDLSGSPVEQSKAILQAVSSGEVSIDDATQLLSGIASSMKIKEAEELEIRISALELQQEKRR